MQTNQYLCKSCYNFSDSGWRNINPSTFTLGDFRGTHYGCYFYIPLNDIPVHTRLILAEFTLYPNRDFISSSLEYLRYRIYPAASYPNPFQRGCLPPTNPPIKCLNFALPHENNIFCYNITSLATSWIEHHLTNYGFYLELVNCRSTQIFAGISYPGVEPFLSLTYMTSGLPIPPCHPDCIDLPARTEWLPTDP